MRERSTGRSSTDADGIVTQPGESPPWERVKPIFLEALEHAASARSAFLDQTCGDDHALRQEIDSLLASEEAAGDFCETPAASMLDFAAAEPSAVPRLEPGRRLGAYEISSFLSAGGMGEVYRARHTILGRVVAIKTLSSGSPEPGARNRLIREAKHAATLSHPNVCRIYEVGEVDDSPFIVMELIEGTPLNELIRSAPVPHERIVTYGVQIAAALEHAHAKGLVHRDLKSSNVVIDTTDRPIVLDFGLARRVATADQAAESMITRDSALTGTLSHMAPEVLLGGDADARSDIWSLGVLLFQLATGELPFTGRTSFEVSAAILGEFPRQAARAIPLGLRLVIRRCLSRNPNDRYSTAAEIRSELESLTRRSRWKLTGQLLRTLRPRMIVAAGVAAAVLAIAFSAAVWWRVPTGNRAAVAYNATSIGVMPFENLSADQLSPYFVGAVHNEVVSRLAAMAPLRVVSRTSIAAGEPGVGAQQVGRELTVGTLLRGSVRFNGDQLVVNLAVADAETGAAIITDGYERRAADAAVLHGRPLAHEDSAAIHAVALRISAALVVAAAGGVAPEPRLAFVSDRNGSFAIFTMNSDGSGARLLTDRPGSHFAPAWSPDGRQIAFSSVRAGAVVTDRELYVMNADGTEVRQLTSLRASAGMPAWSPDGRQIAFHARLSTSGDNTDWGLYVMNADGSDLRRLQVPGSSLQPSWSSDGKRLAFFGTQAGNEAGQIHVINVDGTGLRQLTSSGTSGSPAWQPGGNRILFSLSATPSLGQARQIYVMNDDGTGQTNLSRNAWRDDTPTWGSDGRIYFVSNRHGPRDLYSMNLDGTDQRRLTYDGSHTPDSR